MSQLTNPNQRIMQRIAWFFIVLMINQIGFPVAALALTSGPTQPEVQSFQPVGTTDMVNLFSGDFNYNIPLFEVPGPDGGYPINLFYNSVTDANTEASWTGLGWNVNIGSLSRSMRGLPDDLNGDLVKRKQDMLKNETVQAGLSVAVELAGWDGAARFGLSLGTSYIYNSYKGAGFTIEPGTSVSFGKKGNGKFNPGLNMGLSLSSIDAASFNTGFSLSQKNDNGSQGFNFGLSFNGREGLSNMTLGYSKSISGDKAVEKTDANGRKSTSLEEANLNSGGVSAGYSFTRTAYTPEVKIPWTGFNISGRFSFTPGGAVVYSKMGVNGSYSMQKVVNGGQWISSKAYGYNYLQNSGDRDLMDFNREKDGAVHRHNRFLATPSMTYDIYSVSGQGVGGMYRAHRNDFGFLHDQTLFSSTGGVAVGFEAGLATEFGFDLNINYSDEANKRWPSVGEIADNNMTFKGATPDYKKNKEHLYYKAAGEMASEPTGAYDYLGGTAPLRLKRDGFDYDKTNGGELESRNANISSPYYTTDIEFANDANERVSRRDRNMSIQPLTNKELLAGSNEILPAYDVKYYDGYTSGLSTYLASPPSTNLSRENNDKNAGFTVLGQNGVRWYYALPVQNKVQREALFSVDEDFCRKRVNVLADANGDIDYKRPGTHDFIDEKEIPEYAHSYMLTSVVGSDYADIDGISGPSDGDIGYWMKTSYVKLSDNYKWRAPFFGANFMEGLNNKNEDDMGSFLYGEREVYLPASIETKTHVAYFEISPRKDARGASSYIQNEGAPLGEESYKLDKIKLYSKKELAAADVASRTPVPIKTVHFEYDYSLCPNVDNNAETALGESGKLTLKKVWFTHENNTRGSLSPYVFDYTDSPLIPQSVTKTKYDYNEYKMDRWGAYKPVDTSNTHKGECDNLNHPYVNQDPNNKVNLDAEIMAWHLSKITMPSGAAMNIELERDDYAYVQNAVATQMVPISKVGHDGVTNPEILNHAPDVIQDGRRIYFELETPISVNSPTKEEDLKRYISDLPLVKRDEDVYKQLYYKNYMNLRHNNNPTWEFVSGYAEIEQDNNGNDLISFDASSIDANNDYTQAYIVLRNSRMEADNKHYHPMLMTAWRFLKGNLPDKMFNTTINNDPKNAIPKLAGLGAGIDAIFKNYYTYAYDNNFGLEVDLSNSFIKLNTPDKIKYGGGARVKKITMEDNWDPTTDEINTKGVVYEYTTKDTDGNTISSGVMENETSVGYDECALRYADITEEVVDGVVKDVHIYEYPLNEGMYPGGGVGYSEVKVRSLASNYAYEYANNIAPLPPDLPVGFGTTGQVVHEFYTAKDFPVITYKTDLDDAETNPWLSMISSFLLFSRRDLYTGTQGYSIELNNMHGQTKGSKTYAQNKLGGIIDEPLTQSEVKYKSVERVIEDRGYTKIVNVLENEVEVLMDDNPNGKISTPNGLIDDAYTTTRLVGVDYDFFMDSRESKSTSVTAGVSINVDFAAIYPLPFPWPSFSYNENQTRLAVTNKVIQRRGIQTEAHAYDGQSHIITTNKVFDRYTGQPVLTTVNNQLGGTIYNYTVPAYLAHSTMGLATANQGLRFEGTLDPTGAGACAEYSNYHILTLNANSQNIFVNQDLIPGDEYIISSTNHKTIGVYMGMLDDGSSTLVPMFDLKGTSGLTATNVNFLNVRSGNRNLLSAAIAQYTSVETNSSIDANPMKNRIVAPVCQPDFVEFTEKTTVYGDPENYLKLLNEIFATPNMTSYYGTVPNLNFYQIPTGSLMYDFFDLFYGPYTGTRLPRWIIQENNGLANLRIDHFGTGALSQCYWPISTVNQGSLMSILNTPTTPLLNASEVLDFFDHVIEIDIPSATVTGGTPNRVNYNLHLDLSYTPPSSIASLVTNHPTLNVKVIELQQPLLCAPESTTRVEVELAQATGNNVKSKTINNVLSASASSFSDNWNTGDYEYCQIAIPSNPNSSNGNTYASNPYITGEKGVWRAKSTYAYVDKRKFEEKANTDVDIKTSGVVDDVALFNWENPFFEYCKNNWTRTEDVTKYNNMGAAVEARDILGNYQTELYAYNDNVVVAKGVNTRYYEMGYEGFEEPGQEGNLQTIADAGFLNAGNLDFLPSSNSCSNLIVSRKEDYRLCYPMKEPANNETYILVRKPFDANINLPRYINLTLENEFGIKHDIAVEETGNGEITQFPVTTSGASFQIPGLAVPLNDATAENFTVYKLQLPSTCIGNLDHSGAALTDWWAGNASFVYEQNLGAANSTLPANNKAVFSAEKAHTGKYSLKLDHNVTDGKLTFPQNTLRMQRGKEYVFSAWVNYAKPANLESFTYDEITVKICSTDIKPSGPIIDGWQKVEGTFTYDGQNTLDIINIYPFLRTGYIDDVRIFPAKANMQSYVYDPINYRLKATLDNNNYATFYIYDEAGSLVLVNRETEKGIKSIQESRDYIKPEQ